MDTSTTAAYLKLAPSLIPMIVGLESAFPARKKGPSKLLAFTNFALGLFAIGGPLAAEGLEGEHKPADIVRLSNLFASSVVAGMNHSDSPESEVENQKNDCGKVEPIGIAREKILE
jgi:hypothetical protein